MRQSQPRRRGIPWTLLIAAGWAALLALILGGRQA